MTEFAAAMGMTALPFVAGLSPGRTILVPLTYSFAVCPAICAGAIWAGMMRWLDPIVVGRTSMGPMTVAHAIYRLVFAACFTAYGRD